MLFMLFYYSMLLSQHNNNLNLNKTTKEIAAKPSSTTHHTVRQSVNRAKFRKQKLLVYMNIILLSTIDFLLNLDILSSLVFFEIIIGSGVTTIFIRGGQMFQYFPKVSVFLTQMKYQIVVIRIRALMRIKRVDINMKTKCLS